jgi:ubiquitin-protein ligase E3 C
VSRNVYDNIVTEDLIPQGSAIAVTNKNLHSYIHRLSHFKQNVLTNEQCRSLLAGFRDMIPLDWIRMFSPHELQLLISGSQRAIDLDDLKRHVHYASGYHESQPYIQGFWRIIERMSAEDQGNFLKFVTSCSRQPLLGFSQLNPSFCIQRVQQSSFNPPQQYNLDGTVVASPTVNEARLPSAATCMNLLKLPQYDSLEILEEKLLYAVRSHSGFELS